MKKVVYFDFDNEHRLFNNFYRELKIRLRKMSKEFDMEFVSAYDISVKYGIDYVANFGKFDPNRAHERIMFERMIEKEEPDVLIIGDNIGLVAKQEAIKLINSRGDQPYLDLELYIATCGKSRCGTITLMEDYRKRKAINHYLLTERVLPFIMNPHNKRVLEGIVKGEFKR